MWLLTDFRNQKNFAITKAQSPAREARALPGTQRFNGVTV